MEAAGLGGAQLAQRESCNALQGCLHPELIHPELTSPLSQTYCPGHPRHGFCQAASACKGMLPWKCGEGGFSRHRMSRCQRSAEQRFLLWRASLCECQRSWGCRSCCRTSNAGAMPSQPAQELEAQGRGHSLGGTQHGRRKTPQTAQNSLRSHSQIFRQALNPQRTRNVPPALTEFLWFYVLKSFF